MTDKIHPVAENFDEASFIIPGSENVFSPDTGELYVPTFEAVFDDEGDLLFYKRRGEDFSEEELENMRRLASKRSTNQND